MGDGDSEEIELLSDAIADRGGESIVCDVTQWPGETPLTYDPSEDGVTLGTKIDFEDVTSAYVFTSKLFQTDELRFYESLSENPRSTLNVVREHRAIFESVCYTLDRRGVEMLPRFEQYGWHGRKPWQMKFLEAEGVPVPDTLFTNSPEEVLRFYEEHEKVVYKPVTKGGGPKILTEEDLTDSRLEDLAAAPVQFQAFVPGDDLRVYYLDGEVVGAMRYLSDSYSFKVDVQEGKEIDFESFEPSAEMEAVVATAGEKAELGFGAADVRLQPDGEFEVLELNNVPRFAAADLHCGEGIAGELADYLLGR